MKRRIEKVAVLGAGTMGARIAAHLANAGIPCYLLDIAPAELNPEEKRKGLSLESPAVRNRIVLAGLEAAKKSRPAAFFTPQTARLITPGNFEDNLAWCGEVDWIVEAVAEKLEIKRALFERVEKVRKPGTIVTSNTSGMPIHAIAEGHSEDFQQHWAGTHFFNPPRYMKLVELIPGPKTRPEVLASLDEICDLRLGKGVVVAKDTPNFIANRIGTFAIVEGAAADAGAGDDHRGSGLVHRPRDWLAEVGDVPHGGYRRPRRAGPRDSQYLRERAGRRIARNVPRAAAGGRNDEARLARRKNRQRILQARERRRRRIGNPHARLAKDGISPAASRRNFASIEAGKGIDDTAARMRALVGPALEGKGGDKANQFLWASLGETCLYAARRIPEIADSIVDVDRAMRWGFGWELGPFQVWDAIGVERMAKAFEREGKADSAARCAKCWRRPENRSTNPRRAARAISTSRRPRQSPSQSLPESSF